MWYDLPPVSTGCSGGGGGGCGDELNHKASWFIPPPCSPTCHCCLTLTSFTTCNSRVSLYSHFPTSDSCLLGTHRVSGSHSNPEKWTKNLPLKEPTLQRRNLPQILLLGYNWFRGFLGGTNGKEPACQCRRCKRRGFSLWVGKIPWRRKWQPTPVFLPAESRGQRSLAGYSP